MPTYEYGCPDCGKPFEIRLSMAEYAERKAPPCPHCGSARVIRKFTLVNLGGDRNRLSRGPDEGCGPSCGPGCS